MTDSCETHDKEKASYLCCHLAEHGQSRALGFVESIDEDEHAQCSVLNLDRLSEVIKCAKTRRSLQVMATPLEKAATQYWGI